MRPLALRLIPPAALALALGLVTCGGGTSSGGPQAPTGEGEVALPVDPPVLPEPEVARLRADLETLASPAFEGRGSGTAGQVKAAAHIAQAFQAAGVAPWSGPGMGGATPYHWAFSFTSGGTTLHSTNVVATIPGTDPVLKEEIVLLSAHHDHLGLRGGTLYPGADDNASGTAGLLELARLLKDSRPKRTLVFLSVSGEELGLWGSRRFAATPPLDLTKVVADLNTDMISRGEPDQLHVAPAHIEGAVTSLVGHARSLAARQGIRLADGTDKYWQRSDHYSFVQKGIPALFFFAGMHADYHQPTDTSDKTDYAKMVRILRLTRDLAWVTASAPGRPWVLPATQWSQWTWASFPTLAPPHPAHAGACLAHP